MPKASAMHKTALQRSTANFPESPRSFREGAAGAEEFGGLVGVAAELAAAE